ncbi:MAG: hypothetical protein AAF845_18550 [Bacteroidota bacterium]
MAAMTRARLVALSLLTAALFVGPPFAVAVGAGPASVAYVFGVWAGAIGAAAWLVERRGRRAP